jgi:hypothetical protein
LVQGPQGAVVPYVWPTWLSNMIEKFQALYIDDSSIWFRIATKPL